MVPKQKIAKAYRAMKSLGYAQKIVKPVLTNLLKLYNNKWKLIEEDNYRVLAEAVLDSEEQKGKSNALEVVFNWTEDEGEEECEPLVRRSKRSSQENQSSPELPSSVANQVNEIENQSQKKRKTVEPSYALHQDMHAKIHRPYSSGYYHGKGETSSSTLLLEGVDQTRKNNLIYDVESDESDSLLPLATLESDGDEIGSCPVVSGKRLITYGRRKDTYSDKEKDGRSDSDLADGENEIDNHQCETAPSDLLALELVDNVVPLDELSPDPPGFTAGNSSVIFADAKGNCSMFPELIDLDAEDIYPSIQEVATSAGNGSDADGNQSESMSHKQSEAAKNENNAKDLDVSNLEGNHFESIKESEAEKDENDAKVSLNLDVAFSNLKVNHSESMNHKQSESEKNESHAKDLLNLYIASSSNGKVKISLTVEPPVGSDFQIPSLEEVLKQVEEQYKNSQTGLSIVRLMNDVCESFFAAGTTAMCTDNTTINMAPSSGVSEDSASQTLPSESNDLELCPCDGSITSNDPEKVHNLCEVSPQIPKFVISKHLGSSSWTIDVNGCDGNRRNIGGNNNMTCSSSRDIIAQNQQFFHYIKDISKGHEAHEISLINEIDNEPAPSFKYISKNVKFQNAYVKFPLARISEESCCSKCSGDCLSLDIPCACSRETGGKFAYAPGGLVKEEFLDNCISTKLFGEKQNLVYCQECPLDSTCKGHSVRKFIKECWYKCGCGMECGNRVVQRGIRVKLQVFMTSDGKGWGVKVLEDVPKGSFICEFVGEIVTNTELHERNMHKTGNKKHTYPVLLDADWGSEAILKDEEALCLDATDYGNVARFINHRCFDTNLVEIPVEVETPDHHYYHLALFTKRKVDAFEELTWDYGIDFNDHTHPVKAFQCLCGSKFCRGRKSAMS